MTRKEFLKGGLFALREFLKGETEEKTASSEGPVVAEATSRCLSRSGCFSCADACEREALLLRPGVGLEVDPGRCAGCGACREACPVDPKGILMRSLDVGQRREAIRQIASPAV